MRRIVWVVSFMLAMVGGLFGQAASGTVAGTVTDQAGEVVPGASPNWGKWQSQSNKPRRMQLVAKLTW
jgi:hypothetical protein